MGGALNNPMAVFSHQEGGINIRRYAGLTDTDAVTWQLFTNNICNLYFQNLQELSAQRPG
jgi:tRNA(Glu) U13 pseudouridine synthase TruD